MYMNWGDRKQVSTCIPVSQVWDVGIPATVWGKKHGSLCQHASQLTVLSDEYFPLQNCQLYNKCYRFNKQIYLYADRHPADTSIGCVARLKGRCAAVFSDDAVNGHVDFPCWTWGWGDHPDLRGRFLCFISSWRSVEFWVLHFLADEIQFSCNVSRYIAAFMSPMMMCNTPVPITEK